MDAFTLTRDGMGENVTSTSVSLLNERPFVPIANTSSADVPYQSKMSKASPRLTATSISAMPFDSAPTPGARAPCCVSTMRSSCEPAAAVDRDRGGVRRRCRPAGHVGIAEADRPSVDPERGAPAGRYCGRHGLRRRVVGARPAWRRRRRRRARVHDLVLDRDRARVDVGVHRGRVDAGCAVDLDVGLAVVGEHRVVAGTGDQVVRARVAGDRVVAVAAADAVVARAARERVVGAVAVDDVVTGTAGDDVVARCRRSARRPRCRR